MKFTQPQIIAILVFATLTSTVVLYAETRTFTSTAGTTIQGELVSVNGDMVTIKKADGQSITTEAANFSAADRAYLQEHGLKPVSALAGATKDAPFINSLGMRFVPVPGTEVLFCTHLTRVGDFAVFAAEVPGAKAVTGGRKADDPSDTVSWNDAKAFCDWLSKKEDKTYRLPTDREWSVAVGIGTQESRGVMPEELNGKLKGVYPWGSQWPPPDQFGNYSDEAYLQFCKTNGYTGGETIKGYMDGQVAISPVMTYKPNKLGLHDMGGNLWQWCDDWYDAGKTKRHLRGASWGSFEKADMLSSARWPHEPDFRDDKGNHTGFRCVLELTKP